jgi:cobalt/nickel transport system ATP-binding protein
MSGLDAKTKRSIRDVILSLHDAGKTILCSTHDFAYVEGLFVRCIVMSDGHAVIRDDDYRTVISDTSFLAANDIL